MLFTQVFSLYPIVKRMTESPIFTLVFVFKIWVCYSLGLTLKEENENCDSYLPHHVSSLRCFRCCVKRDR